MFNPHFRQRKHQDNYFVFVYGPKRALVVGGGGVHFDNFYTCQNRACGVIFPVDQSKKDNQILANSIDINYPLQNMRPWNFYRHIFKILSHKTSQK